MYTVMCYSRMRYIYILIGCQVSLQLDVEF